MSGKRQSLPGHSSNSSMEKKFHIDSGIGVVSGGKSQLQGARVKEPQRHLQVEMKAAVQSRRKHGSLDTYKQVQPTASNASTGQIRQGQGEIAP